MKEKTVLLSTLKTAAVQKAGSINITDVRIGPVYTAVQLDTGSVGLAYTFRASGSRGSSAFEGAWADTGRPVQKALDCLTSESLLERTVGLAAVNALFNDAEAVSDLPGWDSVEGDLLDVLALTKDDRVGMVGLFAPLAPKIRQRAGELLIFEERLQRAEGLIPANRARELLPGCSVVIITATSIINNTFELLAAAASSCRIKAVLGPSTPFAPEIFQDYGVTHLSGVIAAEPREILRVVTEGGGARDFMKWSKKINCILSN
jgi:uncharacterized protein (DUF4213/DUF364 family)